MADIAQLAFAVDSSKLDAAIVKLDKLSASAKKTEPAIDGMVKSTKRAATATEKMNARMDRSVASIKRIIGAYAGFQGLRVMIQMADQYKNIDARLKIATVTQERFNAAQRETFAIAQRSSVAIGATATLYARLQRSVDELGGSQKLALQLTETINQSFAVTGATASEASSGILQLAQALNKGKLNGDEFRSVMENAPRIVDALTKSLGVGKGALADMAEQGRLTAPALVKALSEAKDEIAAEFATLPLTVERSLVQLRNAFTKTIGELDSGVGGTANLAKAIKLLADNLGLVAKAAILAAQIMATVYGAKFLASVFAATKALIAQRVVIAATGAQWQALGVQATGATTSMYRGMLTVQKGIGLVAAALIGWQIGTVLRNEFFIIARLGDDLVFGFMEGMNLLRDSAERAFAYFTDVATFAMKAVRGEIADMIDSMVSLSQVAVPWYLKNSLTDKAVKDLKDIAISIRGEEDATSGLTAELARLDKKRGEASANNRKMLDDLRSATEAKFFGAKASVELGDAEADLADAFDDSGESAKALAAELKKLQAIYDRQMIANEEAERAQRELNAELENGSQILRDDLALRQFWADNAGLSADALARLSEIQRINNTFTTEGTNLTEAQAAAMRQQAIAAYDLGEANHKLGEDTRQAAEDFEQYWTDASDSVADAIGDFATGGIETFDDFADVLLRIANDLVSDLISTFAKDLFAGNNPFEGAFGGQQTQSSNLPSFLQGSGTGFGNYGTPQSGGINYGALAAGAAGVYGAYQSGNPTQGAIAGATAGAQVSNNGWGALIGAIVGAFAGILGGEKEPDVRFGGSRADIRKPEGGFGTAFGYVQAGARQAGTDLTFEQFIGPIQDFDQAIFDMVQGLTGGTEQLTEIQEALKDWEVDLKGSAATAENILGSRFETILGTFDENIQQFVRNAGDLEDQVSALAQVLALKDLADTGQALLPTLDELLAVIDENKIHGEQLVETYDRLLAATQILDQAFAITGTSLDLTRAEFITFAADIAEAAGGLERAGRLWATYFDEFYSAQELAQQRLTSAISERDDALAGLGLGSDISGEDFRSQFEALLPTLTAEEINQWLMASEAIATVTAAQAAYNETLVEAAEQVIPGTVDALRDHLDALREARDEYSSFAAGLRRELSTMGLNDFQIEMRDIGEWTKENVRRLNELAQAAGYAAASETDLAIVHEIAAARAAEAIARLRNAASSLVDQLYGDGLGDELIDTTQGFVDTALGGITAVGQATNALYSSQLAGVQRIQQWLDAQLIGDTSSLTPSQQLDETRRQLMEAFNAAMGGDADALNDITRLADLLLRQGQAFDPSDYPELEAFVRGLLGQLAELEFTEPPGGTGTDPTVGGGFGPGGQINPVAAAIDGGTQTISEERAALVAELFAMVRDLMEATGQSLGEVAASIGLNVQDFITDLGVNLESLTVETTLQLAGIASRLGISLTELATQVGVDLGELADQQSLLNQALGQTIEGLPEEDRRVLGPLFDAITNATNAADANAAIARLTAAGNTIGGDTALALQPFLEGIIIQTQIDESNRLLGGVNDRLDSLIELNGGFVAALSVEFAAALDSLVDRLGIGSGPGVGTGGGSGGVPPTLPGTGGLGQASGSSFSPSATDGAIVSELRGISGRLASLERTVERGDAANVNATDGDNAKSRRNAEQARDRVLSSRTAR